MQERLVIIPTYDEIENIEKIIRSIFKLPLVFSILVVDDNSPDGTATRVKTLQKEFPNQLFLIKRMKKSGLGTAYIRGFKWALENNFAYIFEMDADFSHNPKDLIRLYNACAEDGADVSIGSRYVKGVNVINWPMKRILMSYSASKYVKFIMGLPVDDATAGFVCYKRKVLNGIRLDKIKFIGYAFQIEMKFKSYQLGYKLVEVPVVFTDRTKGRSKMSGRIISEAVFGVIKLKLKSLLGKIQ
ncbi:MAG: polyprenol monophosphomannose synthase [Bacteroidota bacterium]